MTFIPQGSIKLGVKYSILVKQYALTADAFNFLEDVKKNTEQTGSVFDPQPSALKGNIHSISNPGEPVIGFIRVCNEQTKRIFIRNSELPGWDYHSPCFEDTVLNDPKSIEQADGSGLVPTRFISLSKFLATYKNCIDCTLSGTNIKPPFWQ